MEFPFKKNKYGFFFAEFGFLADNSLFSMLNITLGYKIFDTSKSISPIFSGGLGYYLSGDGYYSNESGLLIDLKIGLNLLNAKYGVFQLLLGLKTYYYRYGYSTCNTIYENCDAIWHTTSESEYIFTYGVALGFWEISIFWYISGAKVQSQGHEGHGCLTVNFYYHPLIVIPAFSCTLAQGVFFNDF